MQSFRQLVQGYLEVLMVSSGGKSYILGADPGQKGYVALLKVDGGELGSDHKLLKTPSKLDSFERKSIDEQALMWMLNDYEFDIIASYIEAQWGRPGGSMQSVFKLGENYGKLKAAIHLYCPDGYTEITPQAWQKVVREPYEESGFKDKDLSIHVAELLFPTVELPKGEKKNLGGRDDNAAEALLIAYYGFLDWSGKLNG